MLSGLYHSTERIHFIGITAVFDESMDLPDI
jgi:hypothetical protein